MLQYRCALKALESRLEILNEEFSLQHDRNPIESMKSRLKSPSSIMNKMQKRGLPLDFPTMQANIMDVAGVREMCIRDSHWTYFWCSGGICSWIVLYWLNRPYSLGWEQIRFPP